MSRFFAQQNKKHLEVFIMAAKKTRKTQVPTARLVFLICAIALGFGAWFVTNTSCTILTTQWKMYSYYCDINKANSQHYYLSLALPYGLLTLACLRFSSLRRLPQSVSVLHAVPVGIIPLLHTVQDDLARNGQMNWDNLNWLSQFIFV